jgi:sortase A
MVHYAGTPNPGQQGNVIIAFHREPDFQFINQLSVGATITVQNRTCQTYVYRVTQRWTLAPARVTQLGPTSGHELTMVTCDPWWQDYNRLVWRAELVSAPAAGGATGGAVGNPTF